MSSPDLNLLVTLDVLLTEGTVVGAARRLRLSPSAMSRALARLREIVGDPLLVRSGRGLTPTTRALELREQVRHAVQTAEAALRPAAALDLGRLNRRFTLRTADGFVEQYGPALIARTSGEAPGVQLWFVSKPEKESESLRDGSVDLETGVIDASTSPELRAQALFHDRFVGVVNAGHPLALTPVTAEAYASARHVAFARRGAFKGQIDEALVALGLTRQVVTIVGGFATAVALARSTELVATVPERHTEGLRCGLHTFPLPFELPTFTVSLLWHPRLDADPAHRWLRECVRQVVGGRGG